MKAMVFAGDAIIDLLPLSFQLFNFKCSILNFEGSHPTNVEHELFIKRKRNFSNGVQ